MSGRVRRFFQGLIACLLFTATMTWGGLNGAALSNWQTLPTDAEIQQAAQAFVSSIPNRTVYDWKTFKYHDPDNADPLGSNGVGLAYRVPNPDYEPGNADQPDLECATTWLEWWFEQGWKFSGGHSRLMCHSASDTLDALIQRFLSGKSAGWVGGGDNRPPTVKLTYSPSNATPQDTMEFFADASDPDGDALTFAWYLNGTQQSGATQASVQWPNPDEGTHTLKVVVSDGKGGSAQDSVEFTVGAGRAPRLELRPPENPELVLSTEGRITYNYCFQAVSYDDNKGQVVHEWYFDGQKATGISTTQGSPTETYTVATSLACWVPATTGTHTVAVKAIAEKGGTASKEHAFTMLGQWVHVRLKKGDASVLIGGQWYDLQEGVPMSITDGIRSGSVSIRCRGGAGTTVSLVFADGSQLYFDCRSPSVHDDPGGGDLAVDHSPLGESIVIGPGDKRVHVRNVKITQFEAAGWPGGKEGTEFEIDIQPDGTVTVFTFEGMVWFADPLKKKTVHLRAGQRTTGVPGQLPSDPQSFDPSSMMPWWQDEPPPSGDQSLAVALDANGNGTLDDGEIRQAVQYWILGQTVPGTNQTIDDVLIRQLIQMWILGTPVGP